MDEEERWGEVVRVRVGLEVVFAMLCFERFTKGRWYSMYNVM